ncbi:MULTISPECIES: Clp protease N-terminal domain-containing protein [unclassified Streptomyces]|uniref:Clp protease N-terminal domain-containing protein n=1 Tax=unclassified Streptomyces TaxID=2593676 RepID=UPI003076A5E5
MEVKPPDWNIVGILGAARGAQGGAGEAIGTEHLLAGITTAKGPARDVLVNEGATKTALLAVLRDRMHRDGAWTAGDDVVGSVVSKEVLGDDGDGRTHFTGAAARALRAAMGQAEQEGAAKFGAEQLLRGLLEEDNRAVELLGVCGIPPQAVRDRLDGGSGCAQDGLDPLLHATRDVLLGRRHYRLRPFWMRWLINSGGVNWASLPAGWVKMETYEQARRLGDGVVGTEHVLLAILATHEVALQYPHLVGDSAPDQDTRYAGGERLTRLGIDYASVHRVLTAGDRVRLTADARPVEQYVGESVAPNLESTADPGTGPLVEALLRDDTRARQLTEALTSTTGN